MDIDSFSLLFGHWMSFSLATEIARITYLAISRLFFFFLIDLSTNQTAHRKHIKDNGVYCKEKRIFVFYQIMRSTPNVYIFFVYFVFDSQSQ